MGRVMQLSTRPLSRVSAIWVSDYSIRWPHLAKTRSTNVTPSRMNGTNSNGSSMSTMNPSRPTRSPLSPKSVVYGQNLIASAPKWIDLAHLILAKLGLRKPPTGQPTEVPVKGTATESDALLANASRKLNEMSEIASRQLSLSQQLTGEIRDVRERIQRDPFMILGDPGRPRVIKRATRGR